MALSHIVAFNLTLLAAMASPGPALLLMLRTSILRGVTAGIATGAGLGLIAAAWTGAALLGLSAIFVLVPWGYMAMKVGGALYLLHLARGMWRDARQPLAAPDGPLARRAFRTGVLVNLANPKSVLFAAAALLVIFPADLTGAEKGLIVLNHLCVELAVYATLAFALSTRPARDGYLALKPVLDRVAAGLLGLLGLRLLTDR